MSVVLAALYGPACSRPSGINLFETTGSRNITDVGNKESGKAEFLGRKMRRKGPASRLLTQVSEVPRPEKKGTVAWHNCSGDTTGRQDAYLYAKFFQLKIQIFNF